MMQAISRWLLPGKNTGQVLIDRGLNISIETVRKNPADEAVRGYITNGLLFIIYYLLFIIYYLWITVCCILVTIC